MNASNNPSEPRVREIFLKALELTDAAERQRFLDDACAGDAALRAQINALLASHQDDSFLERPAIQIEPTPKSGPEATVSSSAPGSAGTILLQPASARPASMTLRYFGDYELLEEIARGGMGVVYQARQKSLNRLVAVKMILAGQFATEADVKRFHTEAEAAANLKHPNIVAIHEVGEHEGRHYFSMDYIEGKNLAEFIKDNPLPAVRGAQLVKTLAEAVHYAHQRGTLHRDLKPQNVLMDGEGHPHITDFGLAKQMQRDSALTQTGAVMGSPSYMPPEQAAGQNDLVGPPSDVYSIGAVLYHLLTGRVPFVAETPLATLRKVMEEEPVAPSKLHPKTPPDLETICLKCLEKRPERRYATARQLAEELDRFLNNEPILARPASSWRKAWTWSHRHPWAITGAAALLVLCLVGLAFGLWEQVQYLEWKSGRSPAARSLNDPWTGITLYIVLWALGLIPMAHSQYRKEQRLPITRHHLLGYGLVGLVETLYGFDNAKWTIHAYIWRQDLPLYYMVGFGLALAWPFCWLGFQLIGQSIQRHQSFLLGSEAKSDVEPRQQLPVNFVDALGIVSIEFAAFWFFANLAVPPESDIEMRLRFFLVALMGSGCFSSVAVPWFNVLGRGSCVLFLGGALAGFALMPRILFCEAFFAGLAGGAIVVSVLLRLAKSRKLESLDKSKAIPWVEASSWNTKAIGQTLLAELVLFPVILALLEFLSNKPGQNFFYWVAGMSLCCALSFAQCRASTGRERITSLMILILLACSSVGAVSVLLLVEKDLTPTVGFAALLTGFAAGLALVKFGRIKKK